MTDIDNHRVYALIAGENSGDSLGAGLIRALRFTDNNAIFVGIGGPKMIAEGLHSYANMEELSVMGLTEVLTKLPRILNIRRKIIKRIIESKPCVFIGIDSPDFNLYVEQKLKSANIPTVHYVSPSVWAWREKRVLKIQKACDDVLCLLPFEKEWYDKHQVKSTYVGHNLAQFIPLHISQIECRERICLTKNSIEQVKDKVMGILPGSRRGIITRMLPVFAHTARIIKQKLPETVFISTLPSYELATYVKDLWLEVAPDISMTIYVGSTDDVIASCDAVLLTCGTIALETMLLKTPFTVAYKVSALSALIAKSLLKVNVYSLPNLISGRKVVKEFIQDDCTPQTLADEMYKLLIYDNILMKKEFENIHKSMICNSNELAANAVFEVIKKYHGEDFLEDKVVVPPPPSAIAAESAVQEPKEEILPEIVVPESKDDPKNN